MSDSDIQRIVKDVMNMTLAEFSKEISSLTTLTDQEISEIVPKASDREKLAKLIKEVADVEKENREKAEALGQLTEFADIIFPLLKTALKIV